MPRPVSDDAQVVIVGGGLVGTCLATLLARNVIAPERITLLEPRPPRRPQAADDVDLRVSAVSRASQRILAACGVWDGLMAERCSPYERMCVWDAGAPVDDASAIRFDCASVAEPDLGHIVENRRMQWALLQRARERGVVILPASVAALTRERSAMRVELQDGASLGASLVIAADGADSSTRHLMGIESTSAEHGRAVVTHIGTTRPHQRTAWQRFLPSGPIALLPLHDGRSSIVWSTRDEHARELMSLDDDAFRLAVQEATDDALGRVTSCARRADFPLRSSHAAHYVQPNFALVGDAAHAVHPLAGQGVNLGFLDAAALAEVLGQAGGAGLGDLRVLRRYERWRKGENLMMLNALDGLNRLFSNDDRWLGTTRRAGFALANRIGPLKDFFMRRALGTAGDLPEIARTSR